MNDTSPESTFLRDLALLFVAMAYAPDHRLDNVEVDVIAARLRAWQERGAGASVLGALKAALEQYDEAAWEAQVDAAARRLQTACTEPERRRILEDLVAIALADDRFLHAEAHLLRRLARLWDLPPAKADPSDRLWSILRRDEDAAWTPVHDLALLYLAVAHLPDRNIDAGELAAIARKIQEWLPEAAQTDVEEVLRKALQVYADGCDATTLARAIEAVRAAVPAHQHAALLADLHYVACADGAMLVEERALIEQLARALGIAPPGTMPPP